MENLYIASVSSFLASLANVTKVTIYWYGETSLQGMDYDSDELEGAAKDMNDMIAAKTDSPEMTIYANGQMWTLRQSMENGLYVRPRSF